MKEGPQGIEIEHYAWMKGARAAHFLSSQRRRSVLSFRAGRERENGLVPCVLHTCACAEEGFQLPAVAKPVAANGTNSSHLLSLVLETQALSHLETPVILQVCPPQPCRALMGRKVAHSRREMGRCRR